MTEKDALAFPGMMLYLGFLSSRRKEYSHETVCGAESKTFVSQSECTPRRGQAWPERGEQPLLTVCEGFHLCGWKCLPTRLSSTSHSPSRASPPPFLLPRLSELIMWP